MSFTIFKNISIGHANNLSNIRIQALIFFTDASQYGDLFILSPLGYNL